MAWQVSDGVYRPPVQPQAETTVQPAGAAEVLRQLERAIARADQPAARALGDGTAQGLLEAAVGNTAAARIDDVTLRYVDQSAAMDDGRWSAAVAVTWRFEGFDAVPASAEVLFDFVVDDAGSVRIAAIGGADLRTPLWLTGPLEVSRSATVLVTAPQGSDLAPVARRAQRAVASVRRVLPRWRPRLVVEVASSGLALERALSVDPGYYAQIAAVTGSGDGSTATSAPIHVYVNPDVMNALDNNGQQVVLTHEATHVATAAPRSQAPQWLVEGFADYVALRDTDLPLSVSAAQIADQVRREGPPRALPGPAEFGTLTTHLGAVYEAAWLACTEVAHRLGQPGLVRVYDLTSSGVGLDEALARVGRWSERGLVEDWRRTLADLD